MRILVGCEESGKVRDAFIKRGHNAISCDILPSRSPHGPHIKKDIMELLGLTQYHWDIIILFPDCTAMSLSGNRWYGVGMPRYAERIKAIMWTVRLWETAKISCKVGCAIENPTSVLWTHIGKPQYIQPHEFGHGETKKTGILTHNLPQLTPTNHVQGRAERIWLMPPGPNRKRDRGETFDGIKCDCQVHQCVHVPTKDQLHCANPAVKHYINDDFDVWLCDWCFIVRVKLSGMPTK